MISNLIPHLADVLIRGALLLPVCLVVALLLRRGSASLLRCFWRCSLVALLGASALALAPPFLKFKLGAELSLFEATTTAGPTTDDSPDSATGSPAATLENVLGLPTVNNGKGLAARTTHATVPNRDRTTFSLGAILGTLWLLGALILLARKLLGTFGSYRLRRAAEPVHDPSWQHELEDLRTDCGVKHPVELRQHLALRSPIVTGLRKPLIILPIDHAEYSRDDRRAVLLHELAHVRHHDAFFRWIAAVAKILHWPNPLVWFAERSLRLAEERASDDAVLHGGITAPTYADLLARLAKGGAPLVGDLGIASGHAMAQPSGLLSRLNAILRPSQTRRRPGRLSSFALVTTGLALAALVGSSTFLAADPQTEASPKTPAQAASVDRIKAKLDSIIMPDVNFKDATLDEVLEFIRSRSRELDPEKRGINIISKVPKLTPELQERLGKDFELVRNLSRTITLHLEQVPLRALLDFIGNITRTTYRTTDYAVTVSYRNDDAMELESRNFRIEASIFEAQLVNRVAGGAAAEDPDPFAPPNAQPVVQSNTLTATDWLQAQGIEFPDGGSAFYTKAAGTLHVRNTPQQLEFIALIVESLNGENPRSGMRKAEAERLANLKKTLREVVIPLVDFQDATLPEVLDFLRTKTAALLPDKNSPNPVQFVLNVTPERAEKQSITLNLRQVPVGVVLKLVADLAGVHSVVRAYGIEISDTDVNQDLHTATLELSAETLNQIRESIADPPDEFPIADTLREIGIAFPPGTCAFWNAKTGELIVRQTIDNLSQIESFLQGLRRVE